MRNTLVLCASFSCAALVSGTLLAQANNNSIEAIAKRAFNTADANKDKALNSTELQRGDQLLEKAITKMAQEGKLAKGNVAKDVENDAKAPAATSTPKSSGAGMSEAEFVKRAQDKASKASTKAKQDAQNQQKAQQNAQQKQAQQQQRAMQQQQTNQQKQMINAQQKQIQQQQRLIQQQQKGKR